MRVRCSQNGTSRLDEDDSKLEMTTGMRGGVKSWCAIIRQHLCRQTFRFGTTIERDCRCAFAARM